MARFFLLLLAITLFLSSCTDVELVNLSMTSNETINTTMIVRNESRYEEEEPPVPIEVKEGLCTEKVLLALRSCKWSEENPGNLLIAVKNNGYMNVTMAFYFYDGGQVGSMFNDTVLADKQDIIYEIPIKELEDVYGGIEKVHITPILTEDNEQMSCSNKKLPVLISGCGH